MFSRTPPRTDEKCDNVLQVSSRIAVVSCFLGLHREQIRSVIMLWRSVLGPLSCLARQDSSESQHHRRFAGDSAVRPHKRLLPHRNDRHRAAGCRRRGSGKLVLNGWTSRWVDG